MTVKNTQIKKALKSRWEELSLKNRDIINDANERYPQLKITPDRLSKWLNNKDKSLLSETQIIYLCIRWHVPISLNIGEPTIKDGKLEYVIPNYNELSALEKLKIVFPKHG